MKESGFQNKDFNLNPSSVAIQHRLAKILIQEGIIEKNSYERRDYESVDEKTLSYVMSRKTTKIFFLGGLRLNSTSSLALN